MILYCAESNIEPGEGGMKIKYCNFMKMWRKIQRTAGLYACRVSAWHFLLSPIEPEEQLLFMLAAPASRFFCSRFWKSDALLLSHTRHAILPGKKPKISPKSRKNCRFRDYRAALGGLYGGSTGALRGLYGGSTGALRGVVTRSADLGEIWISPARKKSKFRLSLRKSADSDTRDTRHFRK